MTTANRISSVLKAFSLRPIAYHRIYSLIAKSLAGGVLLSQIVYWHYACGEKEFYKSDRDFCDELAIHIKTFRRTKVDLKKLGVIDFEARGFPAKTYYRLNESALLDQISSMANMGKLNSSMDNMSTPVYPICPNRSTQKGQTAYIDTETTAKNTKETTVNHVVFMNYWNSKDNLPKVNAFTSTRKRQLIARLKEPVFADSWQQMIDKLSVSPFYTGENDRKWKANIDWILKNDTNYIKILELQPAAAVSDAAETIPGQAKQSDYRKRYEAKISALKKAGKYKPGMEIKVA